MLIVTYIDEYYRSSSMYLCVFYTKQRKLIKILDGEKSIAKELVSTLPNVFFMLFMFFFLNNVNVLHAYRGQTISFILFFCANPEKLQGLQKRD